MQKAIEAGIITRQEWNAVNAFGIPITERGIEMVIESTKRLQELEDADARLIETTQRYQDAQDDLNISHYENVSLIDQETAAKLTAMGANAQYADSLYENKEAVEAHMRAVQTVADAQARLAANAGQATSAVGGFTSSITGASEAAGNLLTPLQEINNAMAQYE